MIAAVGCPDYEPEVVEAALRRALALAGGWEIKPGMRVFVKANLLMAHRPGEAATTHPAVIRGVVCLLQQAGAIPILGDSPGGPFTERLLKRVYDLTGMTRVAEETGCILNYDTGTIETDCPDGRTLKRVYLVRAMVEADALVNVGKLKTHGLMGMTGATKNLFGCVPGTIKAEYHYRYRDLEDFIDMLLDLAQFMRPAFSFIDAVDAMEGEGPSGGSPRHMGVLLAGINTHELDAAGIQLMGEVPQRYPLIRHALERKLLTLDFSVAGEGLAPFILKDFKEIKPQKRLLRLRVPSMVKRILKRYFTPYPVFLPDKCVGCGDCLRACPPGAIRIVDRKARVDLSQCIQCYCCQELCPKRAVTIRRQLPRAEGHKKKG